MQKMNNREIDELIAQERRAYQRAWRKANKDKVRQHNRNFYLKRAAARLAEQQEENDGNSED